MTKNEFLSKLENELKKNGIEDVDDILGEYEEHFAFKLADGFTEEEIAAKLGKPAELAAQFENEKPGEKRGSRKLPTVIGLVFADLFAAICFALLWAFEAAMAAAAAATGTLSVCLLLGLNIHSWIPAMPYWCGAIFGLSLAALAVLAFTGCIYFAAFIRQLMRFYGRFHHNAIAVASDKASLPSLAINPQIPARANRRIRTVALLSLAIFTACFVLAMIVSMISSGAFGFWHVWGWFGYIG